MSATFHVQKLHLPARGGLNKIAWIPSLVSGHPSQQKSKLQRFEHLTVGYVAVAAGVLELLLLFIGFSVSLPCAPLVDRTAYLMSGSVQYLICDTDVDIMGCLCQIAGAVTGRVFSMCASIQCILHWVQDEALHLVRKLGGFQISIRINVLQH